MTIQPISGDVRALYRLQPTYEPMDDAAKLRTNWFIKRLRLPASGPKAKGYEVMVASILRTSSAVILREAKEKEKAKSKRKPVQLGMPIGNDNWSDFPAVGATVGKKVLASFEEAGFLVRDQTSGKREFYTTGTGKLAYEPIMTCWSVTRELRKLFKDDLGRFVETGRPLILVNKVETYSQKRHREKQGSPKEKLSSAQRVKLFGQETLAQHHERTKALENYWRKHPLVFSDGNAAASASRIFSDSCLKVGGRFYGAWSNLKSEERLACTIDGERLVQLDISASQPTLLSALLGVKMNNLSDQGGWYDPYTQLTGLWSYGVTAEQSEEERHATMKRAKNIAKAVTMEIIGTGNIDKDHPSDRLKEEEHVTQDEWDFFKGRLREAIPALERLEPRYDSKENPTGYINGAGFLAFHESEIMFKTLEALRDDWDIPAYPIHDCLLVKVSDWEIAYSVFVQTICSYVEGMTGKQVIVPIKREGGGMPEIRFRGINDCNVPQHLFP